MVESPKFKGFKKEAITFLKELSSQTSKDWFLANKDTYERVIKYPTQAFVLDLGETLQILTPKIKFLPKVGGSLFKIYRDARYSKDSRVFKEKIGVLFWQGEHHRMQSSAFYLHFDTQEIFYAVGLRKFKPPLLSTYREYIKDEENAKELEEILQEIKSKGYDMIEPYYKRYPKGFSKDDKYAYLSLYNGMCTSKSYKLDEVFYSDEIVDRTFRVFQDMQRMQEWVYKLTLSLFRR